MKKILKGTFAALMLISVTGCVSTNDIKVESVQSEKANLDAYKTYQFIEGSGIAEDVNKEVLTQDIAVSAEIEEMINNQLADKGKTPVSKNPDFFVAYLGGTNIEAINSKLDKKGKETIKKSPEATMLLMLVDAQSGSIIWMSTAEGKVKNGTAKEKKTRLEYAVKKMLYGI